VKRVRPGGAGGGTEARERGDLLVDVLACAVEEIAHLHQLLARAGLATLLPVITAEGRGAALEVAEDILSVLLAWQMLTSRVTRAREALAVLESAATTGKRADVQAAIEPLRRALGAR
jgi:hypothetical protein